MLDLAPWRLLVASRRTFSVEKKESTQACVEGKMRDEKVETGNTGK